MPDGRNTQVNGGLKNGEKVTQMDIYQHTRPGVDSSMSMERNPKQTIKLTAGG